jgi:flagellar protein FlgJ
MESSISSYSDFSGLATLRTKARTDASAAVGEVGQQFEAYFMQMMLKSMRDAGDVLKSDLTSSSESKVYEQMFDEELSLQMAKTGSLGVGQWMRRAMENNIGGGKPDARDIEAYRGVEMKPTTSLVKAFVK